MATRGPSLLCLYAILGLVIPSFCPVEICTPSQSDSTWCLFKNASPCLLSLPVHIIVCWKTFYCFCLFWTHLALSEWKTLNDLMCIWAGWSNDEVWPSCFLSSKAAHYFLLWVFWFLFILLVRLEKNSLGEGKEEAGFTPATIIVRPNFW